MILEQYSEAQPALLHRRASAVESWNVYSDAEERKGGGTHPDKPFPLALGEIDRAAYGLPFMPLERCPLLSRTAPGSNCGSNGGWQDVIAGRTAIHATSRPAVIITRLTAALFALVLAVAFLLASGGQPSSTWKADSGERSGVLQSVTLRAAAMRLDVGAFPHLFEARRFGKPASLLPGPSGFAAAESDIRHLANPGKDRQPERSIQGAIRRFLTPLQPRAPPAIAV